jgi:hypothetical protein
VHIPESIFFHAFFNPGVHLHSWCLNRLPKKLENKLEKDGILAWGIYIVEGPNWYILSILVMIMFVASGIVGILWSVLMKDIQGGFGIASYLAAIATAAITAMFFK